MTGADGAVTEKQHNKAGMMAWEHRKRGGRYYTRSRRVAGRVIREYFGVGATAHEAFREDRERRAARQWQRIELKREREAFEALDTKLIPFNEAADTILHTVLYAAGYHLHKRGEWRRYRG